MEERGCGGGRAKQKRKRVALCRNGCNICCHPLELRSPRKKTRVVKDLYAQADAEMANKNRREMGADADVDGDMDVDNGRAEDGECGSSYYDAVCCEKCLRGDNEEQLLLCDKCDRGFHMYCLRPIATSVPQGDWFCPLCSRRPQILEFPKVQKKIIDFFRIQKLPYGIPFSEAKKRRRNSGGLTIPKKSRNLVLHTPTKDLRRRLEQMASLATALTSAGVTFSDELTYLSGLAPRASNCASLEKGGMQVMRKEDKATFDLSKAMCRSGQWPPLMVTHDPLEGFVVEADSSIRDLTIIAEYTGDVDFMCNRLHDKGDSIMGLLFTEDPSKELVICPDKRGNLARFVSGINNHTPDGKKKQNVRCVRFDVDGEARALLIAIRDIPKGERLYYDYNGFQQDYPTEHFV
ncbi:unnamed protein product [Calypogeia fissa]